ncbi:hypothetical protein OR284_002693 [Enterococcus faecalis]|nr:hypothetical protein [Enterococcus faecalis]EKE3395113.1 hypothetical protein [Enterococcus faecalis]
MENQLFEDTWGYQTGLASSYNNVIGNRRDLLQGIGTSSTTTGDNLGNNYVQFEAIQTFILIRQIKDMLINLFKYENMPPTLNTAQLETMLRQMGGGVCVGKDELGDLVILGRADELGYNLYGNVIPSLFDGNNNFLQSKKVITNRNLKGDYVVFYNKQSFNDFYATDYDIVKHYAKQLATIKATERMNIMQMRSPYIVKGKKNGQLLQVLQSKIQNGDLFVGVEEGSDITEKIEKLDLNVTDRTPSLQNAYRNTFNEMLTLFGIYNNPEQKKERMIDREASSNNHVIEGMGDIYFNARQHAVDLLNLAFGTDIKVQWNSTVASMFRDLGQKQG